MNKEKINDLLIKHDPKEDGEIILYMVLLINCDDNGFFDLPIEEIVKLTSINKNRIYRARSRLVKNSKIKIQKIYSQTTGRIEKTIYQVI